MQVLRLALLAQENPFNRRHRLGNFRFHAYFKSISHAERVPHVLDFGTWEGTNYSVAILIHALRIQSNLEEQY